MPRGPRIEYPGAVHHVYARGIEKREIFFDDQDRHIFLDRLGFNLPRWEIRCHAWALIPNHFHLLVRSEGGSLPSFMRCLLTGYSKYFNDRYRRVGHLFQNRYQSKLIRKESHLREAIRYIHLNPLRAGLVDSTEALERFAWTGHSRVTGRDEPRWHDIGMIRDLFAVGAGDASWVARYRSFMKWETVDPRAGDETLQDIPSCGDETAKTAQTAEGGPPDVLWAVLDRISYLTGIPRDTILTGRKYKDVDARRMMLLTCQQRLEVPVARICRWLGISAPSGEYLVRTSRAGGKVSRVPLHDEGCPTPMPTTARGTTF